MSEKSPTTNSSEAHRHGPERTMAQQERIIRLIASAAIGRENAKVQDTIIADDSGTENNNRLTVETGFNMHTGHDMSLVTASLEGDSLMGKLGIGENGTYVSLKGKDAVLESRLGNNHASARAKLPNGNEYSTYASDSSAESIGAAGATKIARNATARIAWQARRQAHAGRASQASQVDLLGKELSGF